MVPTAKRRMGLVVQSDKTAAWERKTQLKSMRQPLFFCLNPITSRAIEARVGWRWRWRSSGVSRLLGGSTRTCVFPVSQRLLEVLRLRVGGPVHVRQ